MLGIKWQLHCSEDYTMELQSTARRVSGAAAVAMTLAPLLAFSWGAEAFAAGSAPTPTPSTPSTGGTSSGTKSSTARCGKFKKKSASYRNCIKKYAALFNDEDLYYAGYSFAKEDEDYGTALEYLRMAKNQNDPRILTMIGYSLRKSGQIDEGFGFYNKALLIDANYVEAREYMGEAYLQKGDVAGAKAQLSEIAARCGTSCETYVELNKQITTFSAGAL
jgi:tetratricopeptide (TPR) repeat protein